MEFQVQGGTTPVVVVTLAAGEQIGSEAGELGWLRGDTQIQAGTSVADQRGAFLEEAKRAFGGEGLFLTELVGPGKVWLQSITLAGLAQALSPYLVSNREVTEVGAAGVGAALLGGLLKK